MDVLGIWDYLIFGLMLLISAGIGVYFRFSGGKQKTTEEFLLAGQNMSILPVAFSLMASSLSAITMIGMPAEMYMFGFHLAYVNLGQTIGVILSAYLSLPVFFELQSSTVYEYLERRYGKTARTLTSVSFVIQMILYMSVVLYAPSLALSAVTNMSIWVSVVSIGVVCTFYCTLGGMKAVLWTDVFQALLMYLGIFTVLIKGFLDIGFTEVFTRSYDGGRLNSPGWQLDLTTRYTFWNVMLQGIVLSMSSFGSNQVQVQRLLTVKNISRARKAIYVSIPMGVSFSLLNCLVGLVIYAFYRNCDPLTSAEKHITSADQLLPYYMISALGTYPGLPGLCICGIFSASLSTVSSAVNSLTAVTMQDLVRPFLTMRGISQEKMAFIAKTITLFYGFLCVVLTFVVANFGNLMQAALTIFGMLGSPVLAVFVLGMLTTRTNEKGAMIGLISSIALSSWISFGASVYAPAPLKLPVSTEECPISPLLSNTTLPSFEDLTSKPTELPIDNDIFTLYKISYIWYSPIGFMTAAVIGYISSILYDCINGKHKEVPDELLSPFIKYFMKKKVEIEKKTKNLPIAIELQNVNNDKSKDNSVPTC